MYKNTSYLSDFLLETIKEIQDQIQGLPSRSRTTGGVGLLVSENPARQSRETVVHDQAGIEACCPVIDSVAQDNFGSGVLIAPDLVLTAKHVPTNSCFVRVPCTSFVNGPAYRVLEIERHPLCDLALLKLESATQVKPATVGTVAGMERARALGVTLCGFGFERDLFGNLSAAGVRRPSLEPLPVDPLSKASSWSFDPVREFVAGGMFDAETGDSGGPAFVAGTSTVVGIVSRNAAGHKSIFVRVDVHLDWITATAGKFGVKLSV